jgi:hypothetical protein
VSGLFAPAPVAPVVGDLWDGLVLECPSEVATVELRETKKPLISQGFERNSQALIEEFLSEADGTRTRNHRIDRSPLAGARV